MTRGNASYFEGFILVGFSDRPHLEMTLFVVILIFYLLTLLGNLTIILLSALDSRLHTPMYFFLANLSFLDMCFTTGSIPQMLYNLWGPDKTISFVGCAIQLYFVLALGGVECVLLAVMAYDRYAAVCRPLHYTVIMHPRLCGQLASAAWLSGFGNSLIMAPQTKTMEKSNDSSEYGFILVGFSDRPRLELVLFMVNFTLYSVAVLGNSTIILVCILDPRLHTPMYFFLANLSFLDLCFSTSCIPQMLVNLWGPDKTISYAGCAIQLFSFLCVGGVECILLAVMAYDRYAAVCKPLHYLVIMHPQLCLRLLAVAWGSGLVNAIVMSPLTMTLSRCGRRRVNHFLCEMPALIKMACVDARAVEMLAFSFAILIVLLPLALILASYGYIAVAVLKIKSAAGRLKAFNTCSSHLT
ncbi:OR2W1 protein, partial [Crocuta crocuta]